MVTLSLIVLSLFFLAASTVVASLRISILAMGLFALRSKYEAGDPQAQLVYPIRARGNELLVSLTLLNTALVVAFVLVVHAIVPPVAYVNSVLTFIVSAVLLFGVGELLPRLYLKDRGLQLGALLAPYTLFVLELMRPLSTRIARLLDIQTGRELPTIYSAEELSQLLDNQAVQNPLHPSNDELAMIRHVLHFGDKRVGDIMTPKSMVAAIEASQLLTMGVLKQLHDSGHSRFPVYKETIDTIIGTLYLRELIDGKKHNHTAQQAMDNAVYFVRQEQDLWHILNAFFKTKHHLFIVVNEFKEVEGIVTIEDVIEQIIGREIVDEFDAYDNLRSVAKMSTPKKPKNRLIGGI